MQVCHIPASLCIKMARRSEISYRQHVSGNKTLYSFKFVPLTRFSETKRRLIVTISLSKVYSTIKVLPVWTVRAPLTTTEWCFSTAGRKAGYSQNIQRSPSQPVHWSNHTMEPKWFERWQQFPNVDHFGRRNGSGKVQATQTGGASRDRINVSCCWEKILQRWFSLPLQPMCFTLQIRFARKSVLAQGQSSASSTQASLCLGGWCLDLSP